MTTEDARAMLTSFEGATESEHHGHPDFRVGGKIFATLWPDEGRTVLRLPMPLAESLAAEPSGPQRIVGRSGGMGWLSIQLADVSAETVRPLAELAYEARR